MQPVSNAEKKPRRSGTFWPLFVVVLLGGQVILMLVMAYMATSDPSFAIEPDYYQKGLDWDQSAAQTRENARLGWRVRIEVGDSQGVLGERTVHCTLHDRDRQPLDGADVHLMVFPHARGNQRREIDLAGTGNGVYTGHLRFDREGLWEFRFIVNRGPLTFTQTDVMDVFPAD
jgi:nitrogen fixation protein FixH